ncbi:UbiA family prenyltransferase [Thermodesulfobacteriota bacterium]
MNHTFDHGGLFGINRLKLFFALSRTPHGIIDIAGPALAALLCLGAFPSFYTVILGLITAFAGYTAVYALNDVVDFRIDKEKVNISGYGESENDLDSVWVRHPLAKGMLSLKAGLIWVLVWMSLALIGAYLLNPVCALILLGGAIFEIIYCRMLKVSPLRSLINGVVKSCGAIAAVFAVNPNPSFLFLGILFLWIFFWEIGGQNIPNDWTDLDEDKRFCAQTIPVKLGPARAGIICMICLLISFIMNQFLLLASPLHFSAGYFIATLIFNAYFLLLPALRLNITKNSAAAMTLFNKASYFPLVILGLVLFRFLQAP